MNVFVKLFVVALFGVACAACSNNNNETPQPRASAPVSPGTTPPPASSAIPMQAPAAGSSSVSPPPPVSGPSLAVILQRPTFAKAFADMDGASVLPAWAKGGDASAPSARVQVEGRTMWLSHVCEATDCQGGQLFLLTDPAQHVMQGLLVEASGGAGDSVRKLTWLGKPDAATQAFLKQQTARD